MGTWFSRHEFTLLQPIEGIPDLPVEGVERFDIAFISIFGPKRLCGDFGADDSGQGVCVEAINHLEHLLVEIVQ